MSIPQQTCFRQSSRTSHWGSDFCPNGQRPVWLSTRAPNPCPLGATALRRLVCRYPNSASALAKRTVPAVLTTNAIIVCNHGGHVEVVPRQFQVSVQGGFVICDPDLVGAPIVGCLVPATPATSPCTNIIEVLPGSSLPNVLVGGRPAYVQTLIGITNGVIPGSPPGQVAVVFPGQECLQAP